LSALRVGRESGLTCMITVSPFSRTLGPKLTLLGCTSRTLTPIFSRYLTVFPTSSPSSILPSTR